MRAVRLTAQDMLTSLLGTTTPRFGGLRGGYATASLRPARVRLVGYQYVPGVKVSGLLTRRRGRLVGTLTVFGGRSVPASVKVTPSGRFNAKFTGGGPVVSAVLGGRAAEAARAAAAPCGAERAPLTFGTPAGSAHRRLGRGRQAFGACISGPRTRDLRCGPGYAR